MQHDINNVSARAYVQKTAAPLCKIDYKVCQEHKTDGTIETCIKSVKQMRE